MGALPTVVIIGAMKCGTSALHRYLDRHPQVAMSEPKELNFFFGPDTVGAEEHAWAQGTWGRGVDWYAGHFPSRVPVRGESSPGYTSPDHPEAAERMAKVIPDAKLIYLVRDPIDRAVSQYRHHRREGAETRPMAEALLDPGSQYLSRGRYAERLAPYLRHFDRSRIMVVVAEDLLSRRRETLQGVYGFLGVDHAFWSDDLAHIWHTGEDPVPPVDAVLRARLQEALRRDAERLRALTGHRLDAWSV